MKLKELLLKMSPCEQLNVACSDCTVVGNTLEILSTFSDKELLAQVNRIYTNELGTIVVNVDLVYFSELKVRLLYDSRKSNGKI